MKKVVHIFGVFCFLISITILFCERSNAIVPFPVSLNKEGILETIDKLEAHAKEDLETLKTLRKELMQNEEVGQKDYDGKN